MQSPYFYTPWRTVEITAKNKNKRYGNREGANNCILVYTAWYDIATNHMAEQSKLTSIHLFGFILNEFAHYNV